MKKYQYFDKIMVIKRGIIMNLKNRHFLTLKDYSKEEIRYLLDLAHQLKADKKAGKIGQHLLGKNVCLIFEKHQQEHVVHLKWLL